MTRQKNTQTIGRFTRPDRLRITADYTGRVRVKPCDPSPFPGATSWGPRL
jgi:hypothetical protein